MNPELIYFLKVNFAIVVFYGFYRLLSNNDTFFKWRRVALLSFLAISFLHPLMDIQNWVKQQEPMVALADIYATVIMPELSFYNLNPVDGTEGTLVIDKAMNWQSMFSSIIIYLYIGIVLILFIRLLIQFIGLMRLRFKTRESHLNGYKIRLLTDNSAPFSFFKWIFINPSIHTDAEINEILIHEQTHARQWHSIDVIISELLCIVCWFNPFMWLVKREIRINLEYLADNKVLETGHDCKVYQYHLLGLANHKQVATLYNNFNVLPLKNRIKMMNKKRTKQIGRAKYFIFPLLAAALLLISNIEAVARTTEKLIEEIVANDDIIASVPSNDIIVSDIDQQDPVFEIVEKMPEFPGGQAGLLKYLSTNIKYPVNAEKNKIQGRVTLQFVVNKDGSVANIKLIHSVDPELDAEATRVISAMPKWIPGEHKGETVRVKYTVPVVFRLQAPPPPKIANNKNKVVIGADGVYEIPEKMPEFPGGSSQLLKYIGKNTVYPQKAQEKGDQGRVVVQFVVEEDGSITNPVVKRGVSPELDAEALRLVKSMPKWNPGMVDNKPVRSRYTVPISYRYE